MILAALAVYLLYAGWLAWRLPWTDGEYTALPAGEAYHLAHAHAYPGPLGARVGGVVRLPYRTPGSYWLYAWAGRLPARWQLGCGRAFSVAISAAGVAITLAWARAAGGDPALWMALLLLLGSATVVGTYASASYESLVATLWVGGLYAVLEAGLPAIAALCGLGLLAMRITSAPAALILWGCAGWAGLYAGLGGLGWLLLTQRSVLRAGFQALGRVSPPPGPHTTWAYAARAFAQRFEPWALWGALAVGAGWPALAPLLVASAVAFVVGYGALARVRPKWMLGYLPELMLPVIVALAVHLATLPTLGWVLVGVGAGWGLARPRHPGLSTGGHA